MFRIDYRLALALLLSLLAHLAPLLSDLAESRPPIPPPRMRAELRPAERQPPPVVPLELPEPVAQTSPTPQKEKTPKLSTKQPSPQRVTDWQHAVRQQFKKRQERGDYYPAEAIALGQQGEVLVLLFLDNAGNVAAARVEESSGYPLLDQAALNNVRNLRSLPADAPRETLLPIRFRLN